MMHIAILCVLVTHSLEVPCKSVVKTYSPFCSILEAMY